MMSPETVGFLVLDGLTFGRRVRLARIAKGWRQIDLAAAAGLSPVDIVNMEHDRSVHFWKAKRAVVALGLAPE